MSASDKSILAISDFFLQNYYLDEEVLKLIFFIETFEWCYLQIFAFDSVTFRSNVGNSAW